MKHMRTGAFSSGPDNDLVLPLRQDLPAQRLRPEPGEAWQIVSVNDDLVEPDGRVGSTRTLDRLPETLLCVADARSPEVSPRDSAQIV
jgi:hypothetical protein